MAPSEQTAAAGDGRHCGQTAPDGRKETQCPQVCAHSVRPGDGAFKSREGKPQLHSLQFYINFTFYHYKQAAWLYVYEASLMLFKRWEK